MRGDLPEKLGRSVEAAGEFRRAASLTQNESEHQLLLERAEALEDGPDGRPKRIQGKMVDAVSTGPGDDSRTSENGSAVPGATSRKVAEAKTGPEAKATKATRRPRGEPRRLLLDAARDLFARQGYRRTTTREIVEAAGVAEHLLFRNFGSKAALFREALVTPFTNFVDSFNERWKAVVPEETDEDELAGQFVGQLYDLFVEHRGLVVTLWASDALGQEELAEAGIADVERALAVLGRISAEGMDIRGQRSSHPDLAARSTVAMVAGMAAFHSSIFGASQPSREDIVDELTQAILHGFLHRER